MHLAGQFDLGHAFLFAKEFQLPGERQFGFDVFHIGIRQVEKFLYVGLLPAGRFQTFQLG